MSYWKQMILYIVSRVLRCWAFIRKSVFDVDIPHPPEWLVSQLFNNDRLATLEFLSDVYFTQGCFLFQRKIYLLNPRLSLKAVHKLDKGASDYLPTSPLKSSFLNTSDKSPDVRHVIAATFRKSNIEQKGHAMIEIIEKALLKLSEKESMNMSEFTLKIALDIVGKVLLDLDLESLDGKQDPLLRAMTTILHRSFALGEVAPDSQEFAESSLILDDLTDGILCESLDRASEGDSFAHQLYKAGGTDEAKSNLKLFLMAGSETTASSLPVMLYILADRPKLQRQLQKEADEWIDRVQKDPSNVPPQLDSALKELLRTYAIAPYISRRTDVDMDLGNIRIPAKSDLRIFMWGIHRSQSLWHDSKTFHPDRFTAAASSTSLSSSSSSLSSSSSSTSASSTSSPSGGTWIPFGAGSRICIGQHLAWMEMRLVLMYFLHHFSFHQVPETKDLDVCVDWEHAVVHPVHDVILGVTKRRYI